jgi:hypothetical protein
MAISCQVFHFSLLGMSTGYSQRALVDESGMSRTLMGTHSRSKIVAECRMPCAIPHCNCNTNTTHKFYLNHYFL